MKWSCGNSRVGESDTRLIGIELGGEESKELGGTRAWINKELETELLFSLVLYNGRASRLPLTSPRAQARRTHTAQRRPWKEHS